jgi:glycine betaine/choline ABC-type transport system substrate-binding protein
VTKTLKGMLVLAVVALIGAGLAACGSSNKSKSSKTAGGTKLTAIEKNPANAGKTITVGSKNFTEEFILGNIYAQGLKAAGYNVKTQLNLGSEQIAHRALKAGQIDAYPEYTGTSLTSFFGVKIAAVPKEAKKAYEQTKAFYAKEGITALPPSPFNDSQAVGMTKKEQSKLGVKTVSDLKPKAKDIVFAGTPECKQRLDCLLGLQQVYGLKFKKFTPVDIAQRYKAADSGQAQLIEIFTTDGQLAGGKYVILTDDKKIFPVAQVSFGIRDDALKRVGPNLQKVIDQVQKGLTTPVMQELNSRVDIDKQEPKDVARQYLRETGLVK